MARGLTRINADFNIKPSILRDNPRKSAGLNVLSYDVAYHFLILG